MTAADDNGNKGDSAKFAVTVDNTAPTITATPPSGANAMIFSPDGDGNKDTFKIAQKASKEDLWTAIVTNAAGAAVRTVETKDAEAADFAWDGKTDSASIAPDGVYAYRISAKDRAGKKFEIAQQVRAQGTDIYDRSRTEREVFFLATDLAPGDSGSALVDPDGEVVGVAFAIAPDQDGVGYALTDQEVRAVLDLDLDAVVDTGPCLD